MRGDVGTVGAHLEALARLAPDALPLYRAAALRELAMASAAGDLAPARAAALRALLESVSEPLIARAGGRATMHLMHGTVATIRGARATPRFVRPVSRGRRRRLGLDGVALQAEPSPTRRSSPLRPLAGDLRGWRGTVVASVKGRGPGRAAAPRRASLGTRRGRPRRSSRSPTAPPRGAAEGAHRGPACAAHGPPRPGGSSIRLADGRRELVLGLRRRERDRETWTLPKGTPNPGETTEQTALREVAEETGLEVRIVEPVGPIEYCFVQDRVRIHKTVHYFLMAALGGDLAAPRPRVRRGGLGPARRGATR